MSKGRAFAPVGAVLDLKLKEMKEKKSVKYN